MVDLPLSVRWLLLILAAYAILYFLANRAPYYPEKYPGGFWDMQKRLGAVDVWLRTSDRVRIHGWFVEQPGAPMVTLFLHGNAGNITYRISHFEKIPLAGSSLLMIDYRGFGRSSGWPTEGGLYRDAEAAYYYLLQREYSASHIVLHGESLGTAVAVDLAARHAAAGLILEAPFTSAHQLAASVRWTPAHLELRFARKIRTIHTPLFIIHGDRDELIPQQMGTALFAAAAEPKLFWSVPGAGLNDILETAGPDYVTRLRNYYAGLSQRTPAILPD